MVVLAGWLILQSQSGQARAQVLVPGISVSAPIVLKSITSHESLPGLSKLRIWSGSADNCNFAASVGDFADPKKAEVSRVLGENIAGMGRQGVNPRLVIERNDLLKGWPGTATTLKYGDGFHEALRCFKVGGQVVLLVGSYKGDARPVAIDKFLDSLQLDQKGTATSGEPQLNPFPLGDSGMSAFFPRVPSVHSVTIGHGDSQKTLHTFDADYALRQFEVGYPDLPYKLPEDEDGLMQVRKSISAEMMEALHGVAKKQVDVTVGKYTALKTDFTIGEELSGTIVVFLRDKRLITIMQFGPTVYEDPEPIKAFFGSLKFAS